MTKKTLWLASWYPNRLFPFNGDFIKRHAEALSLYHDVHVIHVVRDVKGLVTKNILVEESTNGRLAETIVYYYQSSRLPFFSSLFSAIRYRRVFRKAITDFLNKEGQPRLVHVHTGMNAGLMAWWLKNTKRLPYVLTEHWTGFLEESVEKFEDLPSIVRMGWINTIRNAESISLVSAHLQTAFKKKFDHPDTIVIPNVVDTTIFHPTTEAKPSCFLHISGLDRRKNPLGILAAFKKIVPGHPGLKLKIIGSPGTPDVLEYVKENGLKESVSFHAEMAQTDLAKALHDSIALILYSNAETFGCVIIEANASGVPVIVSDIPVFHETVQEGINGYFAHANDPGALAQRMLDMISNRNNFNKEKIASLTRSRYSYNVIGKQISDWYDRVHANLT